MKDSAKSPRPKKTDKPVDIEEQEQIPVDENSTEELEQIQPEEKLSEQIPAKLFVKKLQEELKGENISKNVFIVFQKIVPPVDTEENYRKIWKTTFKRQ